MVELTRESLNKLKCQMCKNLLSYAPIIFGKNGENICGRCFLHAGKTVKRNYIYEELATYFKYPCRFKNYGCSDLISFSNMHEHETNCSFKEFSCRSLVNNDCTWRGPRSNLKKHFEQKHENLIVKQPCTVSPVITRDSELNILTMVYGLLFLIQARCKVASGKIWHDVRCLADSKLSSIFEYTLHVVNEVSVLTQSSNVIPEGNLMITEANFIETNVLLNLLGPKKDATFIFNISIKNLACYMCEIKLDIHNIFCTTDGHFCGNCAPNEAIMAKKLFEQNDILSPIRRQKSLYLKYDEIKPKVQKSSSFLFLK